MIEIVSGTTPPIEYKFKKVVPTDIVSAFLTIKMSGTIVLKKDLTSATVTDTTISWMLSQEESLALGIGDAEMMLNWLDTNGVHGVGKTVSIRITPNHITEVMT